VRWLLSLLLLLFAVVLLPSSLPGAFAADGPVYRSITRTYDTSSYYTKGLLKREVLQDASGRPFTETENTYVVREKDLYFYHPDHIGSSNYVTDLNGKLYEHLEYFPFGEGWIEENTNVQRTPYRNWMRRRGSITLARGTTIRGRRSLSPLIDPAGNSPKSKLGNNSEWAAMVEVLARKGETVLVEPGRAGGQTLLRIAKQKIK
jgi:hypothetical protein